MSFIVARCAGMNTKSLYPLNPEHALTLLLRKTGRLLGHGAMSDPGRARTPRRLLAAAAAPRPGFRFCLLRLLFMNEHRNKQAQIFSL